jgi:hypothetical protein
MVRYAKLPLHFDATAVQEELLRAGGQWAAHLNTYHYTGSWTVLSLRSPGGRHDNIIPELQGNAAGFIDTIHMHDFPSVKKLLSAFQCPIMSARFLNLRSGAIIKQHRDLELALEKGEARLHFPVITNPDVEFYCEDERICLNEGECWYLNANIPHRVSNLGMADRIHLVVDLTVNDWLIDLIHSSSQISRGEAPEEIHALQIIEQLRQQNTAESIRIADLWEKQLLEKRNLTNTA